MSRTYLGQNFLVSEDFQKKIVGYFEPKGGVVEIGPGRGALTQHLKDKFESFLVIEKDPELAKLHRSAGSYRCLEGDFLDWNFEAGLVDLKPISFIGNLPYESGSAMILEIVAKAPRISDFVFLLQKEVVERITASPRSRDFGSFSVLVQGQFEVEALDIIGPEFFNPPPKVKSQILRGRRRLSGAHPIDPKLQKFLKTSFLNKRKTLKNAWKGFLDPEKIKSVFERFQFSDFQRAEEIEVDLWPKLFEEFFG